MEAPQTPNYEYLVNSDGQKVAELMPIPMSFVGAVEEFLIAKGCASIRIRRDARPK